MSVDSTHKLPNNLGIRRVEDGIKLREINLTEEIVKRLVRQMEREEEHAAEREAQPKQSSSEEDSNDEGPL